MKSKTFIKFVWRWQYYFTFKIKVWFFGDIKLWSENTCFMKAIPCRFMVKLQTSEIRMTYEYIRVTYSWHTSTYEYIRVTYQYIQGTYGWHTSTYEWHRDNIWIHTSDIRTTYAHTNDIRVTYKNKWYTKQWPSG